MNHAKYWALSADQGLTASIEAKMGISDLKGRMGGTNLPIVFLRDVNEHQGQSRRAPSSVS